MDIKEYAKKILEENDCDIYTYGGEGASEIMHDLIEAYMPQDLEYSYLEVANAILAMSRPRPIVRSPYRVAYVMDNFYDTLDVVLNDLEEAKKFTIGLFCDWIQKERKAIAWFDGEPTKLQAQEWDYMICDRSAVVEKYNPNTDDYEELWYPSDGELSAIGWKGVEEMGFGKK